MFCIWKAEEHRSKETEARRRLTTIQEVLESDPQNEAAKEMVEAAKEDLNLVEETKLRDIRTWSRVKWIRKGHAATKESLLPLNSGPLDITLRWCKEQSKKEDFLQGLQ
jgi:hypothetical protein